MFVLIGNKSDDEHNRKVSKEEGEDFSKVNNTLFFETSVKNRTNVETAFFRATRDAFLMLRDQEDDDGMMNFAEQTIQLNPHVIMDDSVSVKKSCSC